MDYASQNSQINSSSPIVKIVIVLTAIIIIIFVFLIAYYLGLNQAKKIATDQSNIVSKNISFPTSSPNTLDNQQNTNNEKQWTKLSVDLGKAIDGSTWHVSSYIVRYPADADAFIYDGNIVGWPFAQMELLLNNAVSIGSNVDSKINYQIKVGISDVDPSICYKTTCLGAFKSIDSIEDITVASISGKLVHGRADNGGGVILPTPGKVETVILPHNGKYIILHNVINSSFSPSDIFNKILQTFELLEV